MVLSKKLSIRPNTSIGQIRRAIGRSERERKRESEKRRQRLEKLARWVSGKDVRVYFQPRGAKCQKAPSAASHDLEVYVPTAEHDQPATELDPAVWDFVFQKAELIHELLHVIYTDFEAFEEYMDKVNDLHEKELFRQVFNIGEDGAIERQGAADFNIGNDLEIKNRNLMVQGEPGDEVPGVGYTLDFLDGVETFLMDKVKFDTGRARQLLNPRDSEYQFRTEKQREALIEFIPRMFQFREDILTEPNGRERIRVAYEFYRDLEEHMELHSLSHEAAENDAMQALTSLFPNDGEVYVVMPGEPPEDADELEVDEDDVVIFLEPPDGGDGSGGENQLQARYGQQVEADDEGDEGEEDVEKWSKSVERTGETLRIPNPGTFNSKNWTKGMQLGKKYRKALKRVLQRERRTKEQRGQRAGRPDTQALWQLGYGNSRVFTQTNEPDEKDYSVVILLDRSGSMGGDHGAEWIVDEAEATAIGLAWALEELGAEVSILSAAGEVYLEKPFGASVESQKEVLARNESTGTTPLRPALALARDRLQERPGESLVFSITDGYPDNREQYKEELEKVTFPVVAVYFGDDVPDESAVDGMRGLYHRIETSDKEGLGQTVEQLIKKMVV